MNTPPELKDFQAHISVECHFCGGRGYWMRREDVGFFTTRTLYKQMRCDLCEGSGRIVRHVSLRKLKELLREAEGTE